MRAKIHTLWRGGLAAVLVLVLSWPAPCAAYSVLSHEAIIDSAWQQPGTARLVVGTIGHGSLVCGDRIGSVDSLDHFFQSQVCHTGTLLTRPITLCPESSPIAIQ
jgi:hypothetical protein